MSREKEERKKRKGEMRLTTEMKIANEYEIGYCFTFHILSYQSVNRVPA